MKRILIAAIAGLAFMGTPAVRVVEAQTVSEQVKRRKMNKTANKINVFYGYASERKGKGQKKREASIRKSRGWK